MHFSITFLICLLSVSGFQFNRQCRSSNNFRLNDARLAVDLESLSRPELQSLAKAFGIKANGKSSDLVQQLGAIKSAGTVPTSTIDILVFLAIFSIIKLSSFAVMFTPSYYLVYKKLFLYRTGFSRCYILFLYL